MMVILKKMTANNGNLQKTEIIVYFNDGGEKYQLQDAEQGRNEIYCQ